MANFNESDKYYFVEADICDYDKILSVICKYSPDFLVNFAAESHVDRSIDDPNAFIYSNIIGTYNLLSASRAYLKNSNNHKFKFIHISTDEVFGSLGSSGFFSENSSYAPTSPYSASKASSDHLAKAWFHTYDFPVIVSNCSNNYRPYQFPEKLIPLIIANCIDEKPLPIYGNGLNIRDWLYVEDHCDAIFKLLTNASPGETYNIGGNNEKSNLEIVKTICRILDNKKPRKNNKLYEELIDFVDDRPGHDYRYAIDSSKIKNDLGWIPNETFESGIKKTIDWYLNNEEWWRKIQQGIYSQERLGKL